MGQRIGRRDLIAAVTPASLALARCSGVGVDAGAGPVTKLRTGMTLQYLGLWTTGTTYDFEYTLPARFAAKFPGINAEYVGGAFEKLLALFAAGTLPDVVTADSINIPTLIGRKVIRSVDGHVRRDKIDLADFLQSGMVQYKHQGQNWGLPRGTGPLP